MQIDLTKPEIEQLLSCIDAACKAAPSSLQAANQLLPLAIKLSKALEEQEVPKKADSMVMEPGRT